MRGSRPCRGGGPCGDVRAGASGLVSFVREAAARTEALIAAASRGARTG